MAADTPTRSEPTRPGPYVAATASISSSAMPACTMASAITGFSISTWARDAISGTTPPKRAWRSIWLEITDESCVRPSRTTAAAVSSQELSMPSTVRTDGVVAGGLVHVASRRVGVGSACSMASSRAR